MLKNLKKYQIILASKSPRRQQLLKELGLDFTVKIKENIKENYPSHLQKEEISIFLANLKAKAFVENLKAKELIITADTIVCLKDEVLGKPKNKEESVKMLFQLSNKTHEVITGVCVLSKEKKKVFFSKTKVFFKKLSLEEINFYVDNFQPFDKAGAYGIQEWIGLSAIEKIEGSYFNVVGLPVQKLYECLKNW